jgi:hypothetical protein
VRTSQTAHRRIFQASVFVARCGGGSFVIDNERNVGNEATTRSDIHGATHAASGSSILKSTDSAEALRLHNEVLALTEPLARAEER